MDTFYLQISHAIVVGNYILEPENLPVTNPSFRAWDVDDFEPWKKTRLKKYICCLNPLSWFLKLFGPLNGYIVERGRWTAAEKLRPKTWINAAGTPRIGPENQARIRVQLTRIRVQLTRIRVKKKWTQIRLSRKNRIRPSKNNPPNPTFFRSSDPEMNTRIRD